MKCSMYTNINLLRARDEIGEKNGEWFGGNGNRLMKDTLVN